VPFDWQLQAPSKDTSFLERPSLYAAKRFCIQGRYRRYINLILAFYLKILAFWGGESAITSIFQSRKFASIGFVPTSEMNTSDGNAVWFSAGDLRGGRKPGPSPPANQSTILRLTGDQFVGNFPHGSAN